MKPDRDGYWQRTDDGYVARFRRRGNEMEEWSPSLRAWCVPVPLSDKWEFLCMNGSASRAIREALLHNEVEKWSVVWHGQHVEIPHAHVRCVAQAFADHLFVVARDAARGTEPCPCCDDSKPPTLIHHLGGDDDGYSMRHECGMRGPRRPTEQMAREAWDSLSQRAAKGGARC